MNGPSAKADQPLPPVLLVGGHENALSVARSLGRRGIRVHAIGSHAAPVRHSRYCRWVGVPWLGTPEASWTQYLLGPQADELRGALLLACDDTALEIVAHHRDRLAERFLLDDSNPQAQLCMLNKLATYQAAQAAGVPTPRFWVVAGPQSLPALAPQLVYPLLVKPLLSHRFGSKFGGRKFFVAHDFAELAAGYQAAASAGVEVMLVEVIPGPDDRLSSYYTYLADDGAALLDFTKRVIRRFPTGQGAGCHHITGHVPEVRALALKLFRHVGLRGLANAEFKLDERDGQLKLIECNARFTAADCLLARAGCDLASFVYNRHAGLPLAPLQCRPGLRLWYPWQDLRAFLELRRRGQLGFFGWLRSVAHRHGLPYFRWNDPVPSLVRWVRLVKADVVYCRVRDWVRNGLAWSVSRLRAGAERSS